MKIDQQNASAISSGTSTNATQGAALNSAAGQYRTAASGGNGDQAEISGLSRAIQTFQNDRSARVGQLTALVRSGKYEVSPALISKGIVSEALSSGSQSGGAVAS
jgi:anti-sigma28 factor (negative regulator of flagellin synthesis)